jgi:hypothetical protein
VGHRVARSTIAGILKAEGIPPSRERPTRLSELDLSGISVGRLDLSALGPNEIVDTAPQGSPSA